MGLHSNGCCQAGWDVPQRTFELDWVDYEVSSAVSQVRREAVRNGTRWCGRMQQIPANPLVLIGVISEDPTEISFILCTAAFFATSSALTALKIGGYP